MEKKLAHTGAQEVISRILIQGQPPYKVNETPISTNWEWWFLTMVNYDPVTWEAPR
jgi:hypothetical protein